MLEISNNSYLTVMVILTALSINRKNQALSLLILQKYKFMDNLFESNRFCCSIFLTKYRNIWENIEQYTRY